MLLVSKPSAAPWLPVPLGKWPRCSHAECPPSPPQAELMVGLLCTVFVDQELHVEVKLVTQLCLTPCNPIDCSLSGSSVHGILQAIILEWVAISFSRGSSRPRDQTWVSSTVGRFFTIWAPREDQELYECSMIISYFSLLPKLSEYTYHLYFVFKSLLNLLQYCFRFMFWFFVCEAWGILIP